MAHVRELPPLRLHLDVEAPAGRHYRWGEDEPRAENISSGLRFSDTMPGGFESLDVTLPRKSSIGYSDLERLSTIRALGAGGEVAWEGRLERVPSASGGQMAISPSAVGWQAHLEDDKSASEIYVDRDLSHWGPMSRARRINLPGIGVSDPENRSDSTLPALNLGFRGAWTATQRGEAWYDAGPANSIAAIYYDFEVTSNVDPAVGSWAWFVQVASNDIGTAIEGSSDLSTASSGSGYHEPTARYRYGVLRFERTVAGGTDGEDYIVVWRGPAVYGGHGLELASGVPAGLYASDVVAHAVRAWAPLLNITADSIHSSGFAIPHLVFRDRTTAGEIIRQATRYGLQDWGVWEGPTFWWHERGARGRKWRARVGPSQLEETGPQVDRLWESVIVQHQDVDGSTKTVGPPGSGVDAESGDLKDNDPENPANVLGITRRDLLVMGVSTAAGAIEVGRRFLEESKVLNTSGVARIVGHIEDDRGVIHPYWRVRAGDTISFVDASDTSYRRIVRTDKSAADRSCSIDLDSPPEGLAALLERLGVVLVPLGI